MPQIIWCCSLLLNLNTLLRDALPADPFYQANPASIRPSSSLVLPRPTPSLNSSFAPRISPSLSHPIYPSSLSSSSGP